jgi:hypothetical protein
VSTISEPGLFVFTTEAAAAGSASGSVDAASTSAPGFGDAASASASGSVVLSGERWTKEEKLSLIEGWRREWLEFNQKGISNQRKGDIIRVRLSTMASEASEAPISPAGARQQLAALHGPAVLGPSSGVEANIRTSLKKCVHIFFDCCLFTRIQSLSPRIQQLQDRALTEK